MRQQARLTFTLQFIGLALSLARLRIFRQVPDSVD